MRTNLNYRLLGTSTAAIFLQMIILSVYLLSWIDVVVFFFVFTKNLWATFNKLYAGSISHGIHNQCRSDAKHANHVKVTQPKYAPNMILFFGDEIISMWNYYLKWLYSNHDISNVRFIFKCQCKDYQFPEMKFQFNLANELWVHQFKFN